MSKNNSLLNYWSAVPSRDATATTSAKDAKSARQKKRKSSLAAAAPTTRGSGTGSASLAKRTPSSRRRAASPPRDVVMISSSSTSLHSLGSDDSFPPSPVRGPRKVSSPPPRPALNPSSTAARSSQARPSDSVVQDSDDDGDSAESLQTAVRPGKTLSSSWSSIHSSIVVAVTTVVPAAWQSSDSSSDDGASTPPRPKRFNMDALLRHAKQDDTTEAAVQRLSAAFPQQDGRQTGGRPGTQADGGSAANATAAPSGSLSTSMIDSFIGLSGKGAGLGLKGGDPLASMNKDRLRRAFDRTGVASVSEQWYFFKEHFAPPPVRKRPFPQKAAKGRWTVLRDASMRHECLSTGIVRYAMEAADQPCLPDELFLWILNEASTEPLPSLRAEYAGILCHCPEQVRRFVDAERLQLLFQQLGPRWESIDLSARLELVPAISHPYPNRDWTQLRSLLVLIATLAEGGLSLDAVRYASKILLRLGIDRLVEESLELLQAYQDAMRKLVQRVPPADWVDYCHDVCLSLYSSIQKPSLRWQVLACLPSDLPACHELRRRLTSVFLFDDAERARQDPHRTAVGGHGLARLTVRDDLVVTGHTNYADLVALINMLDLYVDDAGREAVVSSRIGPAGSGFGAGDGHTAAAQFDADVDELACRFQAVGRNIEATSGGHMSRLESKTALDRVQIRLTHAVRTRRPGRRNIFGPAGEDGGDAALPKQKDIRSFLLQKPARKKA